MVGIIDTHCHLYFEDFSSDLDHILEQAGEEGISSFIVPGIDFDSSMRAINLAERYPSIYAAVGIHPNSDEIGCEAKLNELESLLPHPKVVAIGEIGLDYYRNKETSALQKSFLEHQFVIAEKYHLPVIVHNRNASSDLVEIVSNWINDSTNPEVNPLTNTRRGVFHSFSEDYLLAQKIIDLGFFLGISGAVTYPKADKLHEVVSKVTLSRIVVETDAPFLPPQPFRGKRNEPRYLYHTVNKIATLRNSDVIDVIHQTTENAKFLFGIN